jgi:LysM repeat protein/ABC-type branched-subunit amino acid transport system substrate-binding protein
MKFFYNSLYFIIFYLLCVNVSPAQTLPNSSGYRSGTLYYYFHIIQKDETLSQIAKIYNLSVNEILEVNTTIQDPEKIIEGQKIKVPNYSNFIDQYPHQQWNFVLYRVKQGDKLKNIAKEFGTDVDDIKNVNPGIENKPVVGAEIRVPVRKANVEVQVTKEDKKDREKEDKKNREKEDKNKKEQDKPIKNPALTFDWGGGNSDKAKPEEPVISDNINCAEYIYRSGTVFKITLITPMKKDDGTIDVSGTSFLGGALIAVNEMKNNGMTIKLNSFNLSSSNSIDRILRSPELTESNIIIAQAPVNDLAKLAAYANENRIHLIIPYESAASNLVENNPYVVQLYPSDDAVFKKLMSKQYNEDVFPILVKPEKPDSLMLNKYRTALKKRFGKFVEQTHKMASRDWENKDILDANKLNLIFVCSVAESFVSDLIDRLNLVKYRLSVYGKNEWQSFGIINKSHYFNTNVHLVQPVFVDYNNDAAKLFVQLYRKAYNNEPGKYAFLGYDATYYFLSVLRKYGPEFQNCLSGFDSVLLQSRYKLVRNNANSGFVNEGCFLLEYTSESIEIKRE